MTEMFQRKKTGWHYRQGFQPVLFARSELPVSSISIFTD